jgi:hypothetical protein
MNEQSLDLALPLTDTRVISRIDRAIADNLDALKKTYGRDHEIARDFIIFISTSLKTDMFGFTRFTMSDFIKVVGRDRRELSSKHSYLTDKSAEIVEYKGHQFISVFDYVLHLLQSRNLIFSKAYSYLNQGRTVEMEGIQIIKQLKITTDTKNGNSKVYDIRLSEDFLNGFISRYYTFEVTGYPKVGKGKGGDGRKTLYLMLSKAMHQNISDKVKYSWYSVDFLCKICDVHFSEPAERKRLITKYLNNLIEKGGLKIAYEFVIKHGSDDKHIRGFWIKVDFMPEGVIQLRETKADHHFHSILSADLKAEFSNLYGKKALNFNEDESDPFQRWVTNPRADWDIKRSVFMNCYSLAYKRHISIWDADLKMSSTSIKLNSYMI